MLECIAHSFSMPVSSGLRNWAWVSCTAVGSCIASDFFTDWATREAPPFFISLLFYWETEEMPPLSLITKIVPSHYNIFKWCWSRYRTVCVSFLIFHVFLSFSSFRHTRVCAVLISLSLLLCLSLSACIYCICWYFSQLRYLVAY